MDARRFDDVARAASGRSRRGLLKALFGGALAVGLGVLGPEAAEARLACRNNSDCNFGRICLREGGAGEGVCRKDRRLRRRRRDRRRR